MSSRIPRRNFSVTPAIDRTALAVVDANVNVPRKAGLTKVVMSAGISGTSAVGKDTVKALKSPLVSTGSSQARMSRVRSPASTSSPKSTVTVVANDTAKRISHVLSSNTSIPSKASVHPQATSRIPTTSVIKPKSNLTSRNTITFSTEKRSSIPSISRRPISSSFSPTAAASSLQPPKAKNVSHIGTSKYANRARLEGTKSIAPTIPLDSIKEEAVVDRVFCEAIDSSAAAGMKPIAVDVSVRNAIAEAGNAKMVCKDSDTSVAEPVIASRIELEVTRTSQCILESEAYIDENKVVKEKEGGLVGLVVEPVSHTSPKVEESYGSFSHSSSQQSAMSTSWVNGPKFIDAEGQRATYETVIASRPKSCLRPLLLVSKHKGLSSGTSEVKATRTRPVSRCRSVSLSSLATMPLRVKSSNHTSWTPSSKPQKEQTSTRRWSAEIIAQPINHFYRHTSSTVPFGWSRRLDARWNVSNWEIENASKKDEEGSKKMEITNHEGIDEGTMARKNVVSDSDVVVAVQDVSIPSFTSAREVSTNVSVSHLAHDNKSTNVDRMAFKKDDSKNVTKMQIFDPKDVSVVLQSISVLDSSVTANGSKHVSSPVKRKLPALDFNQDNSTTSSPQSNVTSSTFFADSFDTSRSSLDPEECVSPTKGSGYPMTPPLSKRVQRDELHYRDSNIDNTTVVSGNIATSEAKGNPGIPKNITASSDIGNPEPVKLTMKERRERLQQRLLGNVRDSEGDVVARKSDLDGVSKLVKTSVPPEVCTTDSVTSDFSTKSSGIPQAVNLSMKERRECLQQQLVGSNKDHEEISVIPKPVNNRCSTSGKPVITTCTTTTDATASVPTIQPSGSLQAIQLNMKERRERLQQRLLGNVEKSEEDDAISKRYIDDDSDSKKAFSGTTEGTASGSANQLSGSPQAVKLNMKDIQERLKQRLLGNVRDPEGDDIVPKLDTTSYSNPDNHLIPTCTIDDAADTPVIQRSSSFKDIKLNMKERRERLQQRLLGIRNSCEEDTTVSSDSNSDSENLFVPNCRTDGVAGVSAIQSSESSKNEGDQWIVHSKSCEAKSVIRDSWAPLEIFKNSIGKYRIEESATGEEESEGVNLDDMPYKQELIVENSYGANEILDDYYISDADDVSHSLDRPELISNTASKQCTVEENAHAALSFSCSIQDIKTVLSGDNDDTSNSTVHEASSKDYNVIIESINGDSTRTPGPLVQPRNKSLDVDLLAPGWQSKAAIAEQSKKRKSSMKEIPTTNSTFGWYITTTVMYLNGEVACAPQKSFIPSSDMAPMTTQALWFPPTPNFSYSLEFDSYSDGKYDRYPLDYYSLSRHIERTVGYSLATAYMSVKVDVGASDWDAPLRSEDDFKYWVVEWSGKAYEGELEIEIVLSEDERKGAVAVKDTHVNDEVVSPAAEWPTKVPVNVSKGDDAVPFKETPSAWTVSAVIRDMDGSKSNPYTFRIPTSSTSIPAFEILQLYTSTYLKLPLTGFQMLGKVEYGKEEWYEPIRDAYSFSTFVDRTQKSKDDRSLQLEVSLFGTNHETLCRYIEPPPVEYVESVDDDSFGTGSSRSTKTSYSSSSEESNRASLDQCINRDVSDEQDLSYGEYDLLLKSSLASKLSRRSRTLSVDRLKSGFNKGITKTESVRKGLKRVASFFKK